MQTPAETATSSSTPSFAGLLAALTTPAKKPAPAWTDDALEDDVATLSYERALQARARYRSTYMSDRALTQSPHSADASADSVDSPPLGQVPQHEINSEMNSIAQPFDYSEVRLNAKQSQSMAQNVDQDLDEDFDSAFAPVTTPAASYKAAYHSSANVAGEAQPQPVLQRPNLERNLKSASITIRLSEAECTQLRLRAAEAGLTVSAYLRSCTFEAESLRALVKETMAQLRSATAAQKQPVPTPAGRSWFQWLMRLITPWQTNQRVVRA